MNVAEAIKHLESLNYRVYPRGDKWSVWWPQNPNNRDNEYYSDRELIRLADTMTGHKNWHWGGAGKKVWGDERQPWHKKLYNRNQRRHDKRSLRREDE